MEECSEKYRKLVPDESKRVIKNIKDLGMDRAIITHDVRSLITGVHDELGFDLEKDSDDLMDNDFSFHNSRVSGVIHDRYGRPRVHDKAHTIKNYMSKKGYETEDVVLVVHGSEDIQMARTVKNRVIVPEKGSCRKLREIDMGTYKNLESLPEMISIIFERKSIL